MKKIVLFICIAMVTLCSKAQNKASLTKFWDTFRPLLVQNKFSQLANHVKFPLSSRGVEDGMKVLKITKNKFAIAMTKFLALENYDTQKGTTELKATKYIDVYKAITTLNNEKEYYISGKNARIGDLEFRFTSRKWMLTLFYDGRTE
jgi:hypothetical protein